MLFVKRQLFVVFICHMCWVVCSIISYQPQQGCCSAPHCYTSYYLNMLSFFISQCLEIKYFHLFMGHRKYYRKIINLIRFSIFLFCWWIWWVFIKCSPGENINLSSSCSNVQTYIMWKPGSTVKQLGCPLGNIRARSNLLVNRVCN